MKLQKLGSMQMTSGDQNGFTLVEALISTVLLSIVTLGISSSLMFGFRVNDQVDSELTSIRETRQCLPRIIDELRYCESLNGISSDNSTLYYKIYNADDVLISCAIFRSPEDGKVYCQRGDNAPVAFSTKAVDQIVFTQNDSNFRTVKVDIDIDGKVLSTTVRAVNYGTISQ